MQNHAFTPAHAIENRSRARDGANWKSCSQRLSERTDVGFDSVILLASAGRVAKPGNYFVEDQQYTTVLGQLAQSLQVALARGNASHVCHDRLGDHGGQVASMFLHDAIEHGNIVPWGEHDIVEDCGRNAFRVGNSRRIFRRAELLWRMPMRVQDKWIVPPVVVTLELQKLGSSRVRSRQA